MSLTTYPEHLEVLAVDVSVVKGYLAFEPADAIILPVSRLATWCDRVNQMVMLVTHDLLHQSAAELFRRCPRVTAAVIKKEYKCAAKFDNIVFVRDDVTKSVTSTLEHALHRASQSGFDTVALSLFRYNPFLKYRFDDTAVQELLEAHAAAITRQAQDVKNQIKRVIVVIHNDDSLVTRMREVLNV